MIFCLCLGPTLAARVGLSAVHIDER